MARAKFYTEKPIGTHPPYLAFVWLRDDQGHRAAGENRRDYYKKVLNAELKRSATDPSILGITDEAARHEAICYHAAQEVHRDGQCQEIWLEAVICLDAEKGMHMPCCSCHVTSDLSTGI